MTYTVILSPEEIGYSVFCPAFGIASQGDDRDDALRMIVDAMEGWMLGELEDGRDIPIETLEAITTMVREVLEWREEEGQEPTLELTQVEVVPPVAVAA